jgi:hypothetical protein
LKILIDYYAFHLEGFRKPKSLEVLAAVFSWNESKEFGGHEIVLLLIPLDLNLT